MTTGSHFAETRLSLVCFHEIFQRTVWEGGFPKKAQGAMKNTDFNFGFIASTENCDTVKSVNLTKAIYDFKSHFLSTKSIIISSEVRRYQRK